MPLGTSSARSALSRSVRRPQSSRSRSRSCASAYRPRGLLTCIARSAAAEVEVEGLPEVLEVLLGSRSEDGELEGGGVGRELGHEHRAFRLFDRRSWRGWYLGFCKALSG